jgi:transcriptional regulator with XRE-family HTH domain
MNTHPADKPEDYPKWINDRIGAEVRARREALHLSAYALGKAAGNVSDQTILNIEQGFNPNGCWTGTLARICQRFGTTLDVLIVAAHARP